MHCNAGDARHDVAAALAQAQMGQQLGAADMHPAQLAGNTHAGLVKMLHPHSGCDLVADEIIGRLPVFGKVPQYGLDRRLRHRHAVKAQQRILQPLHGQKLVA